VDTTQLEMKSANGWANWNGQQLADNLLKDLTLKLNLRAQAQMPVYFPAAREAVSKFVGDWMLKQYDLAPDTKIYLRVMFKNETGGLAGNVSPRG